MMKTLPAPAAKKVILVGDATVGKSSLGRALSIPDGQHAQLFDDAYRPTPGQLHSFLSNEVVLFDCGFGGEDVHSVLAGYFKDAKLALLVYDTTNFSETFAGVQHWHRQILGNPGECPNCQMLLVGCKAFEAGAGTTINNLSKSTRSRSPTPTPRADRAMVERFSRTHGLEHFVVSSKTGKNIAELRARVLKVAAARSGAAATGSSGGRGGQQKSIENSLGLTLSQNVAIDAAGNVVEEIQIPFGAEPAEQTRNVMCLSVVGGPRVGKSTLEHRLSNTEIQVSVDGSSTSSAVSCVDCNLWEIPSAGTTTLTGEKVASIASHSQGLILLYDASEPGSLRYVRQFCPAASCSPSRQLPPMVLVGNKCDLFRPGKSSVCEEAGRLAKELGCQHRLCSAAVDDYQSLVEEVLENFVKRIILGVSQTESLNAEEQRLALLEEKLAATRRSMERLATADDFRPVSALSLDEVTENNFGGRGGSYESNARGRDADAKQLNAPTFGEHPGSAPSANEDVDAELEESNCVDHGAGDTVERIAELKREFLPAPSKFAASLSDHEQSGGMRSKRSRSHGVLVSKASAGSTSANKPPSTKPYASPSDEEHDQPEPSPMDVAREHPPEPIEFEDAPPFSNLVSKRTLPTANSVAGAGISCLTSKASPGGAPQLSLTLNLNASPNQLVEPLADSPMRKKEIIQYGGGGRGAAGRTGGDENNHDVTVLDALERQPDAAGDVTILPEELEPVTEGTEEGALECSIGLKGSELVTGVAASATSALLSAKLPPHGGAPSGAGGVFTKSTVAPSTKRTGGGPSAAAGFANAEMTESEELQHEIHVGRDLHVSAVQEHTIKMQQHEEQQEPSSVETTLVAPKSTGWSAFVPKMLNPTTSEQLRLEREMAQLEAQITETRGKVALLRHADHPSSDYPASSHPSSASNSKNSALVTSRSSAHSQSGGNGRIPSAAKPETLRSQLQKLDGGATNRDARRRSPRAGRPESENGAFASQPPSSRGGNPMQHSAQRAAARRAKGAKTEDGGHEGIAKQRSRTPTPRTSPRLGGGDAAAARNDHRDERTPPARKEKSGASTRARAELLARPTTNSAAKANKMIPLGSSPEKQGPRPDKPDHNSSPKKGATGSTSLSKQKQRVTGGANAALSALQPGGGRTRAATASFVAGSGRTRTTSSATQDKKGKRKRFLPPASNFDTTYHQTSAVLGSSSNGGGSSVSAYPYGSHRARSKTEGSAAVTSSASSKNSLSSQEKSSKFLARQLQEREQQHSYRQVVPDSKSFNVADPTPSDVWMHEDIKHEMAQTFGQSGNGELGSTFVTPVAPAAASVSASNGGSGSNSNTNTLLSGQGGQHLLAGFKSNLKCDPVLSQRSLHAASSVAALGGGGGPLQKNATASALHGLQPVPSNVELHNFSQQHISVETQVPVSMVAEGAARAAPQLQPSASTLHENFAAQLQQGRASLGLLAPAAWGGAAAVPGGASAGSLPSRFLPPGAAAVAGISGPETYARPLQYHQGHQHQMIQASNTTVNSTTTAAALHPPRQFQNHHPAFQHRSFSPVPNLRALSPQPPPRGTAVDRFAEMRRALSPPSRRPAGLRSSQSQFDPQPSGITHNQVTLRGGPQLYHHTGPSTATGGNNSRVGSKTSSTEVASARARAENAVDSIGPPNPRSKAYKGKTSKVKSVFGASAPAAAPAGPRKKTRPSATKGPSSASGTNVGLSKTNGRASTTAHQSRASGSVKSGAAAAPARRQIAAESETWSKSSSSGTSRGNQTARGAEVDPPHIALMKMKIAHRRAAVSPPRPGPASSTVFGALGGGEQMASVRGEFSFNPGVRAGIVGAGAAAPTVFRHVSAHPRAQTTRSRIAVAEAETSQMPMMRGHHASQLNDVVHNFHLQQQHQAVFAGGPVFAAAAPAAPGPYLRPATSSALLTRPLV